MKARLVRHKTKTWYNLGHWDKPNEAKCGAKRPITRWRWAWVTCPKCLALRPSPD